MQESSRTCGWWGEGRAGLFSQSQLPKRWREVFEINGEPAPVAKENSFGDCARRCRPSRALRRLLCSKAEACSEAELAPWLTPCLLPNPLSPGKRATAARSRTTQNWPASCDPGLGPSAHTGVRLLSEGLGPSGAGRASCCCRCAPSRSVWEKPCRASTDLNTRSVLVLCLPRDPQSAGSVHYTN